MKVRRVIVKKKFIVLEGLDGSGKTSIGEALARDYSYELVITPGAEFDNQLSLSMEKKSHYVRLMYYYAGNFNMSDYIRQTSNDVVCNRYIYSTMACFSYFNNVSINETCEMMKLLNEKIMLPDLVIYSLGVNTPPLGAVKTNKNNDRMWE
jgi:thymidylate kinase